VPIGVQPARRSTPDGGPHADAGAARIGRIGCRLTRRWC